MNIIDFLRDLVTAKRPEAPGPVCCNCGAPVAWGVVCHACRFGTPSRMAKEQPNR